MAMNASNLANEMMASEDEVIAQYISETSNPAQAENYRRARYLALATAIINHINNNAEIASLTVNNTTYAGSGAHTHTPASTSSAVGKIS